jgi:2-keto-4-pentenoate hydratase/2-oxohepta-3-ene-1,7-dioic acid hydratase in catechol pathway
MQAAGHQVWVGKEVSSITGPFDSILIPKVSSQLIYENELGIVIGKRCKYVTRDQARSVIAGYVVCNDVTACDWAGYSPTFTLSKSFDTFGPIGPWLVTSDEITDPHSLEMRAYISGKLDQVGNTSAMEVDCFGLIEYLSQAVTLEPGDVLATGTPSLALRFLREGDVVRCEIEGLGAIENPVEAER